MQTPQIKYGEVPSIVMPRVSRKRSLIFLVGSGGKDENWGRYSPKYRTKIPLNKRHSTTHARRMSIGSVTVQSQLKLRARKATAWRHFTFCCLWRNTSRTAWALSFRRLVEYWLRCGTYERERERKDAEGSPGRHSRRNAVSQFAALHYCTD
jgi:hypothetical protein